MIFVFCLLQIVIGISDGINNAAIELTNFYDELLFIKYGVSIDTHNVLNYFYGSALYQSITPENPFNYVYPEYHLNTGFSKAQASDISILSKFLMPQDKP